MSAIAARKARIAAEAQAAAAAAITPPVSADVSHSTVLHGEAKEASSSNHHHGGQTKRSMHAAPREKSKKARLTTATATTSKNRNTDHVTRPSTRQSPSKTISAEREESSSDTDADQQDEDTGPDTRSSSVGPSPSSSNYLQWWEPIQAGSEPNVTIGKDNIVIIRLREDEQLALYGVGSVSVLHGFVSINHCEMDENTPAQSIYCAKMDPLPVIRAITSIRGEKFAATIEFIPNTKSGLGSIADICPLAGPNPFGINSHSSGGSAVSKSSSDSCITPWLHTVSGPTTNKFRSSFRFFELPTDWHEQIEVVTDLEINTSTLPRISLIRGPKGVGKSTLARTLFNHLRFTNGRSNKVAFLDLDLGQAEFNVPGTVSLYDGDQEHSSLPLISPNWLTHSAAGIQSRTSYYLGQVTPKDIPSAYLSAVEKLINIWRDNLHTVKQMSGQTHLVVNTMGWTKGLGSELSKRIEEMLQPTYVFDFQTGDTAHFESATTRILPVSTPVQLSTQHVQVAPLPAADLRTLSIMTSLHSHSQSGRWNFKMPLIEQPPFVIDIAKTESYFKIGFVPTLQDGIQDEQDVQRRLMSLNGELVALCNAPETDKSQSSDPRSWTQVFSPSCTTHPTFIALGLIRYIDNDSKTLHLLVPPSTTTFSSSLTLLVSDRSIPPTLHTPIWAQLDRSSIQRAMKGWPSSMGYEETIAGVSLRSIPFLEFPQDLTPPTTTTIPISDSGPSTPAQQHVIGGQRRRVRRNLMRKNQMG
ncbi:unnamed protein product [Sympodiomycopsis kandeliae]